MYLEKMTAIEKQAVIGISLIMGLRMIGLFMVLPIFTLYARELDGATPTLIGLAMGIYGLSQALLQIPFGILSDHIGRKPIITIGLLFFISGSLIAALAHSIHLLIIGRALQGAGAVGGTLLALLADLTREEQRTKSMAIAGITIGLSFSMALILGPLLTTYFSVNHIFLLAVLFGSAAIFILYLAVPIPRVLRWQRDMEPELSSLITLLKSANLLKLNIGIFILHAVFTASFIIIPIQLTQQHHLSINQQWLVYLPALLIAFVISFTGMGIAERWQKIKVFFLASILLLFVSLLFLWNSPAHLIGLILDLGLFFTGFTLLEAFLPSLISRAAPAGRKGSALGIYSCAQFFGIFIGGILGGYLYGKFSFSGVYLCCLVFSLFWFIIALFMPSPKYILTQVWRIKNQPDNVPKIIEKLRMIPGILEVTLIAEEGIVYLKMERAIIQHPDLIRLKNQMTG
jgi:MFS family permease